MFEIVSGLSKPCRHGNAVPSATGRGVWRRYSSVSSASAARRVFEVVADGAFSKTGGRKGLTLQIVSASAVLLLKYMRPSAPQAGPWFALSPVVTR